MKSNENNVKRDLVTTSAELFKLRRNSSKQTKALRRDLPVLCAAAAAAAAAPRTTLRSASRPDGDADALGAHPPLTRAAPAGMPRCTCCATRS